MSLQQFIRCHICFLLLINEFPSGNSASISESLRMFKFKLLVLAIPLLIAAWSLFIIFFGVVPFH